MFDYIPDNPYLLLTPGPLSTSKRVRNALLRDWCTWDDDYKDLVEDIRAMVLDLAGLDNETFTMVPLQGSGTFSVEAVIGTMMPFGGKLLVISNGAYGRRMMDICRKLDIEVRPLSCPETRIPDLGALKRILEADGGITHVAVVHCETTTGILNPIEEIGALAKNYGKVFFVDAMSSFGGVPFSFGNIDFITSSSNKCIQGVPGFGFVIARTAELEKCGGRARSLALDLFDQWKVMDEQPGKWRFTSPTHVIHAFREALLELGDEGGIEKRHLRFMENQRILSEGLERIGFRPILPREVQSPVITTFAFPDRQFDFKSFYLGLKKSGYVIYPGKLTDMDTFRIGNIGTVYPEDMKKLVAVIEGISSIGA